ncbi:hypothetical protein [Xanthomonas campestris]|uniref:hypothetical protein n=1 Tax=Xanthomonas campestris TaxID=339 RepID=UPI000E1F2619|nr:hypothetical protein [Xanthomonas campestris]
MKMSGSMTDPSKFFMFNSALLQYFERSDFVKSKGSSQGAITGQNIRNGYIFYDFLRVPFGHSVKLNHIYNEVEAQCSDPLAEKINAQYSRVVWAIKDAIREVFSGPATVAAALGKGGTSVTTIFFMQCSSLDLGTVRRVRTARPHHIMPRQPDTDPGNLIAALLH